MTRVQIEQQLAALRTEEHGILTTLAGGSVTPELTEKSNTIKATISDLDNKLAVMADAEARLKAFKPEIPNAGSGGARVHDNSEDKPFNGLGEIMQSVRNAYVSNFTGVDPRLRKLSSGANEGISSEGGIFVGSDVSQELFRQVYESSVVAGKCRKIPISGGANGFKGKVLEETSRATGSRLGGVRAYWLGEGDTLTDSKPKFGKWELDLVKLGALMYVTDEQLEDGPQLATLSNEFMTEEMAFLLDDAIINGDGVNKPLGIINGGSFVSQAAEGSQTAATVNLANVTKMLSRVATRSLAKGEFFINSEVFPQLQQMGSTVTSSSQLVYMPPGGVSAAPYGTLFGRPITPIEQAAALGTVGDIFFADFSQYALITKGGIKADQSMHLKFLTDEMAFRWIMRVNGQPIQKSAITPYKGSATKSPFVGLAAR